MNREELFLQWRGLPLYCLKYLNPNPSDIEDLLAVGYAQLWVCVNKYDPKKNTKFDNYAIVSIKGRMVDYARTLSVYSRSVMKKIKTDADYEPPYYVLSIDNYAPESDYYDYQEIIEDHNAIDPEQRMVDIAVMEDVELVISELRPRDRLIAKLCIIENIPHRIAAQMLGLSESRISQIRKVIQNRMRYRMKTLGYV